MAERRMFAKTIIDSDAFLDMPLSAQALYFHLSMRADDDGFVNNPKKIQRMVGASDDDCKLLLLKRFLISFESGVVVIKHWRIHNYIQKDRYKPTIYKEEMASLTIKDNNAYTDNPCTQDVYMMDTQDRLGKDRIGKESKELGEGNEEDTSTTRVKAEDVVILFCDICKSYPKVTKLSDARRKAISARVRSGYTMEDFKELFTRAEQSSFLKGGNDRNWTASFDWLLKDTNAAKVLDGNYTDKVPAGTPNGFEYNNYTEEGWSL